MDPASMDLKGKYAEICKKYAKICINMQANAKYAIMKFICTNMQKYALPTLLMPAGLSRAETVTPGTKTLKLGPAPSQELQVQCQRRYTLIQALRVIMIAVHSSSSQA